MGILMLVILFVSCLTSNVMALEISIGEYSRVPGKLVTVPIIIDKAEMIIAGLVTISYDATILTAENAVTGELTKSALLSDKKTSGQIEVVFAAPLPLSENGELFKVNFTVSKSAKPGAISQLTISKARFNEGKIVADTIKNGTFTVAKTKLIVPNVSGSPSDRVRVPIQIENGEDIIAGEIRLDFDSKILIVTDIFPGDVLADYTVVTNTIPNQAQLSFAGSHSFPHDGTIAEIEFLVSRKATPGTSSSLTLSKAIFNEGKVTIEPQNGKFHISEPPTVTLNIKDGMLQPGEQINIPILAVNAKGLISGNLTVTYTQEALNLINIEEASLSKGYSIPYHNSPGEVKITFAGATQAKEDGPLLNLKFLVTSKTKIAISSNIKIKEASLNEGRMLVVSGIIPAGEVQPSVSASVESLTLLSGKTSIITFRVKNTGSALTDIGYFSTSVSNDLEIIEANGVKIDPTIEASQEVNNVTFANYPPDSSIWTVEGKEINSDHQLLDISRPYAPDDEQDITLTIKAKEDATTPQWIRYRVAMAIPEGGYIHAPTKGEGQVIDQQGHDVYVVEVEVKFEPKQIQFPAISSVDWAYQWIADTLEIKAEFDNPNTTELRDVATQVTYIHNGNLIKVSLPENVDANRDDKIDMLQVGSNKLILAILEGLPSGWKADPLSVNITECQGMPCNIEYTSQVTLYYATDNSGRAYDINIDAYQFENPSFNWKDWREHWVTFKDNPLGFAYIFEALAQSDGRCWGMAATSAAYFEGLEPKPVDKIVREMEIDNPGVLENITRYFMAQDPPKDFPTPNETLAVIHSILEEGQPAIIGLRSGKNLHAVLAYKLLEDVNQNMAYVYIYENNYPETGLRIKFNTKENTFSYSNYNDIIASRPFYAKTNTEIIGWWLTDKQLVTTPSTLEVDWVGLGSDVELLITDDNDKHLGRVDGVFFNEIPSSEYIELNGLEVFKIPKDTIYSIKTTGLKEGRFELLLAVSKPDGSVQQIFYDNVETNPGAKSTLKVNAISIFVMELDRDGDGTIDTTIQPTYEEVIPSLSRPWDVNQDGTVDISDLVLVGSHFGKTGEGIIGDINDDGVVDISDLVLVGGHFGETTGE